MLVQLQWSSNCVLFSEVCKWQSVCCVNVLVSLQVIFKSMKLISVMMGSVCCLKKQYHRCEYVAAPVLVHRGSLGWDV